jgi:hypothetical protein
LFALNALSYAALIFGLLAVRMSAGVRANGTMGNIFREGLAYALQTPSVRGLILGVLVVNVSASSYAVLLPVFARDIFSGDARTLGWLWGRGIRLTAFDAAARRSPIRRATAAFDYPHSRIQRYRLVGVCGQHHLALSLVAMAVLGFGVTISNVAPTSCCKARRRKCCVVGWCRSTPRHALASTRLEA